MDAALKHSRRWIPLALLILAVVLGAWLRLALIDQPVAGYHMFNEGFYTDVAAQDAERGLFDWITEPRDVMNPPGYTVVVTMLFRMFGSSLLLARLVSVLAGLGTIVVTFFVGRALYDERIGAVAAAFLAVLPGAVIISRNAQVDPLLVFLEMAGVLAYVLAVRQKRDILALVSGALLGLGLTVKLPALLVVAALLAWDLWRSRGFGFLRLRRTWMLVGGFALFGLPWHLAQLVMNGSRYLGAQAGVGSSFSPPDLVFWRDLFFGELAWMHWPVFAVFVAIALGYLMWQRATGDKLILCLIAVNVVFYLAFHMHSYYLLPFAPLTALAAARLLDVAIERVPAVGWSVLCVFLAGLVLASVVMLAGHKWSPFSPGTIEGAIGSSAVGADLWLEPSIWGNMGPSIDISVPNMRVRRVAEGQVLPNAEDIAVDRPSYFLGVTEVTDANGAPAAKTAVMTDHPKEVVVFGVAISQTPRLGYHLMINGDWNVRWGAYPLYTFGLRDAAPQVYGPFIYTLSGPATQPAQ